MPARGVTAGVVVTLALLVAPAVQAAGRPALLVADTAPFTVKGANFKANERVAVQVRGGTTPLRTARVRANAAGRFTLTMPRVSLERCGGAFAVATGASGSRAIAKIVFQLCPPPIRREQPD
jgi:hypothetical protein